MRLDNGIDLGAQRRAVQAPYDAHILRVQRALDNGRYEIDKNRANIDHISFFLLLKNKKIDCMILTFFAI